MTYFNKQKHEYEVGILEQIQRLLLEKKKLQQMEVINYYAVDKIEKQIEVLERECREFA